MQRKDITPQVLRELLDCDPDIGLLTWRERSSRWFTQTSTMSAKHIANIWNAKFAGKPAMQTDNGHGYYHGAIFNVKFFTHRVVWAVHTGKNPSRFLDHINRIRTDNRICNLREATAQQNAANSSPRIGSSSKYLGVYFQAKTGKWVARYSKPDKRGVHIGSFDREVDAAMARDAHAYEAWGEFARLNFPRSAA